MLQKRFNPHTHEGCDPSGKSWLDAYRVSIHTPTKGVTNFCVAFCYRFTVSIHTPTKGVTYGYLTLTVFVDVSIHTPTKGVTKVSKSFQLTDFGFNPHTHEGCDKASNPRFQSITVSIHTPTKGVTKYLNVT